MFTQYYVKPTCPKKQFSVVFRPHFKCSWDEVINSHKINKVMRYSVTNEIAVTHEFVSSLNFNMSNDSDL